MTDQHVNDFDYITYRQAVKLRTRAEQCGSALLYDRAADLFVSLDMHTAAEGCRNKARQIRESYHV